MAKKAPWERIAAMSTFHALLIAKQRFIIPATVFFLVYYFALPLLAQTLGGDLFFAFVAAIAFATTLAVVAGLTISASTSFAHDFYTNVIHHGVERDPAEEVFVARATAFVVGAVAIGIAILLGPTANVAFLVALAFAAAASANLPVIMLLLF
jgi:cation/acetate symporter